jgi:hypothetical protein
MDCPTNHRTWKTARLQKKKRKMLTYFIPCETHGTRIDNTVKRIPRGHGRSGDRDHWNLQFVRYVRIATGAQQLRNEKIVFIGLERCPKVFRLVNGLTCFLMRLD